MKNLIVIYTIADDITLPGYFNNFFGEGSIKDADSWECLYLKHTPLNNLLSLEKEDDFYDIILVNDDRYDKHSSISIESQINKLNRSETYVIHHLSSLNRINSQKIADNIRFTTQEDHHDQSGWHYNYLCRISKVFNKDENEYKKILNDFITECRRFITEANIYLWKSLSILDIKIEMGIITENSFLNEINTIKYNDIIKKSPGTLEILQGFTDIKTLNNKMNDDNFYCELFP